jgi:small subunit ribosomal protein S1
LLVPTASLALRASHGDHDIPDPRRFRGAAQRSLGGENETFEGKVVKGTVTAIENDLAVIDVGLKSEGRVPLREFAAPGQKAEISRSATRSRSMSTGSRIHQGEAMLSRDRARREAAWDKLERNSPPATASRA